MSASREGNGHSRNWQCSTRLVYAKRPLRVEMINRRCVLSAALQWVADEGGRLKRKEENILSPVLLALRQVRVHVLA
jgi:hypothetical protein